MSTITSLNFGQNTFDLVFEKLKIHLNELRAVTFDDVEVSIDKLWIKTNHLNKDWLDSNFKPEYSRSSKYYKYRTTYYSKSSPALRFAVFYKLRSRKRKYAHKLELNPSKMSYKELMYIITNLLGEDGLEDHLLFRIDIANRISDEIVSVDAFYYSTYVKCKHFAGEYFNDENEDDHE